MRSKFEVLCGMLRNDINNLNTGLNYYIKNGLIEIDLYENMCEEFADFIDWHEVPRPELSVGFIERNHHRSEFNFVLFSTIRDKDSLAKLEYRGVLRELIIGS